MAKKQVITAKKDTTKVAPRYVVKKTEMARKEIPTSFMSKNDTTKMKNIENVKANASLVKRNAERASEGKKPLSKPAPTLYANSLPAKKKK